ncbi:hypothetical protein ACO34A_09760 [Rhizobium sp. ACO-34A]|nr:diguanylate cyclase [Rhizobium sp. ACO-34A]ATN34090.1 hypothetical protein ACO34A_09760 [Rhizobium sp. ACO-34A]
MKKNLLSAERLHRLPSQGRLVRLVAVFSTVLIVISVLSLLLVGQIASNEADDLAAQTEKRLFHNALRDRQRLMARDLLVVARWDDAVQGVAIEPDNDFISDDFVGSLWWDSGYSRSFIIDAEGQQIASSREDRVDFTKRKLDPADDLAIITRRAVEAYMRYRIAVEGGFSQRVMKTSEIGNISVYSFSVIDGEPAIVSATAIVPHDEALLPDGPPPIAVVAKQIDEELIRDLNSQLAFDNLAFSEDATGVVPVQSASGKVLGSFSWTGTTPGTRIWDVVVPVVLFLTTFLALAGFLIMRHVAKLSAALSESQQQVRDAALHDPLSGLANRLKFDHALAVAAEKASKEPFAVIAGDLDRFKAVNDVHGHAAGDQVIRTVAARLRELVGENGLVGRVGGDEFVILVTGFSDRHRLMLLATQILTSVSMPMVLEEGALVDVGISLGIAVAPACGNTAEVIMAAADHTLLASKEQGRGRALFHEDMPQELRTVAA